ncbi:MAG: glycogen debranching N-terminal domain-containing protein [Xanthobacteraceae bacterium]
MNKQGSPSTAVPVDTVPEAQFYIPATGPGSRPRRTLKHGDTFAVFDSHGDIGASSGGPDGIFHADTRYLSRWELLINGMQPLLLASDIRDDNSVLSVDLTNPDIYFDGHLVSPRDTIHVVRTVFLWRGVAYQRLSLQNHGDRPVQMQLSLAFANDFADLFEVRGLRRARRGVAQAGLESRQNVVLSYKGLDGMSRRTSLLFDPAPADLSTGIATYVLDLGPGERSAIFVTVACNGADECKPIPFLRGMHHAFRELKVATSGATTVETSNEVFNQVLCRSMADLYMLVTDTPQGPYPYAGIPWFSTTFGRDGLITAMEMLWCDPGIARGVLKRLAHYQAKTSDPLADAEPGKILHEMRAGEMAALREIPFGLYYGSVDATPLFVMLAGLYAERTGDLELVRELWPNIEAALGWIDGPGDPDRDGFVEYFRATEQGLANQGWKDSQDAIFHADGRLAEGPIALAEVQAYVFAAKQGAARCARLLGLEERGRVLDAQADALANRFDKAFWCPQIGTYALALDGKKNPCAVRTSNAGQVLFTGIARPDRALQVGHELMRPQFFCGWGIRTVAKGEARYNPMSYHNGSVWPHDNALIALGLARYGMKRNVEQVFKGLFDAAVYMDLRRLPELFCGFRRTRGRGPTLYPVACAPQAWASAAPYAFLQASLGLEFEPAEGEIRLRNPSLPSFLDEVILRNLRLGGSRVDLLLRRHGEDISLQVLRNQGHIQVSAILS